MYVPYNSDFCVKQFHEIGPNAHSVNATNWSLGLRLLQECGS